MARRVDFSVVEAAVWDAVDRFHARDRALVVLGASEWSMAHRLAVYFEQSFPNWNVDCEYNRQGGSEDSKTMDAESGKVRPDITIHRRGLLMPEDNLLVIELKRDSSGIDLAKSRVSAFTSASVDSRIFQYQYGLALVLGPKTTMSWFAEGRPLVQL
ncbi:MAG: hypothetical protein IPP28_11555 [Xanthomonadales bacterium]|nr:hypothetical protein [Xanthomonadales bacterium]